MNKFFKRLSELLKSKNVRKTVITVLCAAVVGITFYTLMLPAISATMTDMEAASDKAVKTTATEAETSLVDDTLLSSGTDTQDLSQENTYSTSESKAASPESSESESTSSESPETQQSSQIDETPENEAGGRRKKRKKPLMKKSLLQCRVSMNQTAALCFFLMTMKSTSTGIPTIKISMTHKAQL